MNVADDRLVDLAASVADGDSVDWGSARSGGTDEDAAAIRELEIIAEIARIHRRVASHDLDLSASAGAAGPASAAAIDPAAPRWGPLVMLERLGSGSFGDVYRAWDTSLDREVALKLLRQRSRGRAADSIAREGQLLARIHHTNVMAIYGAQVIDGQVGIWGEFLRGRTLAQIVSDSGPLSAEETLVCADAICRALAAAHRAGLLHRDVKAQNVIREKGGRIVLMDFGLGRDVEEVGGEGLELAGTPLYLAPELFTGGRASAQSDVYSLGVLMFYLVSGTFPVTGRSLEDIRERHARSGRQRLQDLRPDLTASFIDVVERALEPDPAKRFESAGAMQAALARAGRPLADTDAKPSAFNVIRRPVVLAMIAAAALIAAAATIWLRPQPATSAAIAGRRLMAIEPPPGWRFSDSSRNTPAMSPDGRYVAVAATETATGKIHLWRYGFETGEMKQLPDSERAVAPFWSPDSKRLAFFDPGGTIKVVTLEGVHSATINTSQEPRGGAWSESGLLMFPKGPRSGLYTVAADGSGAERLVIAPDRQRGELGFMWPQFLRDGRRFIYFALSNDPKVRGLYLGSLDTAERRLLVNTNASGVVAGDRLVYVSNSDLVSQNFAAGDATVDGTPTVVQKRVAVTYDYRSVVTVAADEGTIAFVPAQEDTELVWFDRAGQAGARLPLPPGRYRSPAISRDGKFVAVQRYRDGLSEIQVFDLATAEAKPSLAQSADVEFPVWGPGHRLAFGSIDSGRADIYVADFDRDDRPTLLFAGKTGGEDGDKMPTDWSPDGRHLMFAEYSRDRLYNMWALPLDQPSHPFPLRPGEGAQIAGHFAPDGQSAVYVRRVDARRPGEPPERELWACDFPSGDHPRLIASGGIDPAWPSMEEISFFDRAAKFEIIRLSRPASPAMVFETGINTPEASRNNYAWTPDGVRMLVNRPVTDPTHLRVMVLMNDRTRPNGSEHRSDR